MKRKRRSNIGARGSPETNSLIRFMAQQKMKTPLTFKTPEVRCFSGYIWVNLANPKLAVFRLETGFCLALCDYFETGIYYWCCVWLHALQLDYMAKKNMIMMIFFPIWRVSRCITIYKWQVALSLVLTSFALFVRGGGHIKMLKNNL